jgi:hypothetical protein
MLRSKTMCKSSLVWVVASAAAWACGGWLFACSAASTGSSSEAGGPDGAPTADAPAGSDVGTGPTADARAGSDAGTAPDAARDASADAVGTYDGPVADSACPNLPSAGQWQNISPPGSNYENTYTGINAIVTRPDDPATIFTGADSTGFYVSHDCGNTWASPNTGANAAALESGRPWSIALDPVAPDVMYVVEGYGDNGIWKTTNAGVDWQQILPSSIAMAFSEDGFVDSVDIDPTDHTHLVAESHGNCASGGVCAAESTDSGQTWKLVDMNGAGAWQEDSAIAIVDGQTWLYCGLFGGLFATTNEGASWSAIDAGGALPSCNYYVPRVWHAPDGHYYMPAIAYAGPGLLQSAPGDATSWTIVPGSPQLEVMMPTATQLVAAYSSQGTYWTASQSDPTTWNSLTGPPAGSPKSGNLGGGAYFMAYDPVHQVLYVSTFSTGLWRTVMN